ncbi:MAG: GntR family transcriptional regulator [Acidobacteriia bacterium]|nr:GntR family transcriptional regulator [Terriglobia bacterium]
MDIRINKESPISLREQIGAQIEFLVATGELKPGEPLPSVRALARRLRIHHNTVSQAYQDVTARNLLVSKRGSRLLVRTPEERAVTPRPELDDLINQTIRTARHYGYTLEELSVRVRDRLMEEPPDHVLVLSFDAGMRRLLQAEVEQALKCRVKACSPEELVANPELALGALVVSPPGVLPAITEVLPKDRPAIPVLYSSAESHLEMVRKLTHPSIIAVASVSKDFLMVARGLLGSVVGVQHTLVECLLASHETAEIPVADVLFCDAIVFARLSAPRHRKNAVVYNLVTPECLDQIVTMMPVPPEAKRDPVESRTPRVKGRA